MKRTTNALRNTLISFGSFILIFLFGVGIRRLFLDNLSIEYLGYEGLFSNIFAVLSTLDLGAGSILLYRLYRAIAENSEGEIRKLLAMYARLYRLVAGVVLLLGLAVIPLLPLLIRDEISDWNFVYLIYIMQLVTTVGVLYLSYYRLLLEAHQRVSDAVIVETSIRIASQILKVVVILYTKNYLIYLSVGLLYNLVSALLISFRCRREFASLLGGPFDKQYFKEGLFRSELKNSSVIRLSQTVFYLMDTLLVSSLIGLRAVALYGNYTMIGGQVLMGFNALLQPVRASAGNYANTETKEDSYRMFRIVDLIAFFLASFVLTSLFTLFQPTISVIYGAQYLLPLSFLAFYSLYCYIIIKDNAIRMFRETVGEFKQEKMWSVTGAGVNIILSIIGVKLFGITGILMGTFLSELVLEAGSYFIAYRHRFQLPVRVGLGRTYVFLLLAAAEAGLTYLATSWIPVSFGGLALRCVFCLVVPNGLNALLFRKTEAFARMLGYVKKMLFILKNRGNPPEETAAAE